MVDIYVLITDRTNDVISDMGTYLRISLLFVLPTLIYLIYRTEGEITQKKKAGPYEDSHEFDTNYQRLKQNYNIYYYIF